MRRSSPAEHCSIRFIGRRNEPELHGATTPPRTIGGQTVSFDDAPVPACSGTAAYPRLYAFLSVRAGPDPARRDGFQDGSARLERLLADRHRSHRRRILQAYFHRRGHRGGRQWRVWTDRCLGARARAFPRPAAVRRAHRLSVRPTDRGRRSDVQFALSGGWLDRRIGPPRRPLAQTGGGPRRVWRGFVRRCPIMVKFSLFQQQYGDRACPDIRWTALRGSDGPAGTARLGYGIRARGVEPGGQ